MKRRIESRYSRIPSPFSKCSRFLLSPLLLLALLLSVAPASLRAQEDLNAIFNKGVALLVNNEPAKALQIFEPAEKDFGPTALEDYGHAFGSLPYHVGICYLQLKDYPKAVEAFKRSHTKYNNKPPKDPDLPNTRNIYWEKAVLQWAYCEQMQENWKQAISSYEKFKQLADDADISYQQDTFWINLGICYVQRGKLKDGEKRIGFILENFRRYHPGGAGFEHTKRFEKYQALLMQAFKVLIEKYLEQEADEEDEDSSPVAMENDAVAFLEKHRPAFTFRPALQSLYTPLFHKNAAEAFKAEKFNLAKTLIRYIPNSELALEDWKYLTPRYGSKLADMKTHWNQAMLRLKSIIHTSPNPSTKQTPEFILTYTYGQYFEENGANRATYALFANMTQRYPFATKYRPDILYNTTRLAYDGSQLMETENYGQMFLNEWPKDKLPTAKKQLHDQVFDFMLGSLFENGEYEKVVERGPVFRKKFPDSSENAEFIDYCVTASHHFLGNVKDAYEAINNYLKVHPEDKFKRSAIYREHITYFQASNLVALQAYLQALPMLEKFLEKYPKTEFKDSALLELGQCNFAIGEYDKVKDNVAAIRKDFPDTELIDRVDMLEGTVLQAEELPEEAQKKYIVARKKADELGHLDVSAEGLYNLTGVNNEMKNFAKAVEYYDEFFNTYVDSIYEAEVAVEGLKALYELSKEKNDPSHFERGLKRVEQIILDMGETELDGQGLEKLINSYVSALVGGNAVGGYKDALKRLDALILKVRFDQNKIKARLLIAEITALQKALSGQGKGDAAAAIKRSIQGDIKTIVSRLRTEFKKEDLSNSILMLLAIELMKEDSTINLALEYLDDLTGRNDLHLQGDAWMTKGQIYAKKKNYPKAIEAYSKVRTDFQSNDPMVEQATIGLGRVYVEQENWASAEKTWAEYQGNYNTKKWRKATIEAQFLRARSLEGIGEVKQAKTAYMAVVANYLRHVYWAPEAWYRAIQLEKKTNIANARRMRDNMLKRLKHLKDKEKESGKNFIEKTINESF